MRHTTMAERSRGHQYQPRANDVGAPQFRQAFHRPHTSLGAAGHLLHLGMVAAPLIIGEVIQDSDKRWRAMRVVPILGAVASELLWTLKIANEKKREEESRAALETCRERYR
jgi:hypothetical protein